MMVEGSSRIAGRRGFPELHAEIVSKELCARCGGCASVCPVDAISMTKKGPVLVGKCIDCGKCLRVCPGPGIDMKGFEGRLFDVKGGSRKFSPNGIYLKREHLVASEREVFRKGYFGGRVSALLIGALERGDIDAALLTDWSDGQGLSISRGKVARNREEVLRLAGSKYAFSDVLTLLPSISSDRSIKRAAIVCLPCQVHALRKMAADPSTEHLVAKVSYIISLNCGAPMVDEGEWGRIVQELTGVKADRITGFKAFKNSATSIRFHVKEGEEWKEFDLQVYRYLRRIHRARLWQRCLVCADYSGELSDISFGAPLVRTERGKELLERAVTEGRLKRPGLKRRVFQDLMDTYWSIRKKRVAKGNIRKRMRKGLKVPSNDRTDDH